MQRHLVSKWPGIARLAFSLGLDGRVHGPCWVLVLVSRSMCHVCMPFCCTAVLLWQQGHQGRELCQLCMLLVDMGCGAPPPALPWLPDCCF